MTVEYLKKANKTAATGEDDVRATVQSLLDEIERGGDEAARRCAADFDGWDAEIVVDRAMLEEAATKVPQRLKDDIAFAHDNVRRFA
ncbi:MAG: histidinol dehydrogenase, partial [Gammaproteobacteria bacterium]